MEISKRKTNGKSKINGNEKKKKKFNETVVDVDNLNTILFESELNYHSTMTRMQVDALIYEVTINETQRAEINRFLNEISEEFRSIPQGKIRPLATMAEWLEKFNLKIPLEFSKMKKDFEFLPPNVIETIGSFVDQSLLVKSSSRHAILVDLLVEIPHRCIHKKSYLNNEYLEKRAVYLCYLAKKLRQNSSLILEFSHCNETTRNQAILLVKPNENSKFTVRIFVTPEENYLNEKRLSPISSNLRLKWFEEKENDDQETFYSTPNYNSSILFDCRLRSNAKYLIEIFSSHIELSNGLKLLKIWLEQRQLSQGFGSFTGAMAAFYLAHLLNINKINKQMQSYQIFRIALVAFGDQEFLPSHGLTLATEKTIEWKETNPFLDEDCLLLDASNIFNVFHTLTRENYKRVKHEAKMSLNVFNDSIVDHFQALFMTPMKFLSSMDAIIQISNIDRYEKVFESKSNKNQLLMDNLNDKYYLITREILRLLNHGLKDRVTLLCPLPSLESNERSWPVDQSVPKRTTIKFGLLFSDQFDSDILKGAEPGTKEAIEFRRFWSERCELRRFPDGSILESVVWNVDSSKEKRLIWIDVCRYILDLHAAISPADISLIVNDQSASNLLSIPARLLPSYGCGDEQQIHLNQQFIELSKQIRTLNNSLPMKIHSIHGIDETFRYTNVFPPLPSSFVTDLHKIRSIEHDTYALIPRSTSRYAPPFNQSLEILCQLEITNSKDPGFENFQRIQHSKILFCIQLAKQIEEKFHYVCRPTADFCYIEKENYIFRIRISYHKEIFLLESQAGKQDGLQRKIQPTNQSKLLRYQMEYLPKINAAIYGISQKFIHFQLVARLFKRWLSSQLLLYHFEPINADLLCCFVFLHPAPDQPPKSIIAGFTRVLRLLSEFDWVHSPLIINFNNQLTNDEIFEMRQEFKKNRSEFAPMCLMSSISIHESHRPTVPVLKRLIHLAKEALQYLEKNHSDSLKFIFRTSLQLYDAIIVLDPLQCPRAYQAVDHLTNEVTYTTRKLPTNSEKSQILSTSNKKKLISIVDYDPAQCYLNELRKNFNDDAEFFHDEFGGLMICVVWKPSNNSRKSDYVKIIEQWKLLGTGLVKEVQTFPERWR